MSLIPRFTVALVIAVAVGFGLMSFDRKNGAEWVVSPEEIAAGNGAVETRPGTVAVLPIRSETADLLPFKWAAGGIAAGLLAFAALRRKTA